MKGHGYRLLALVKEGQLDKPSSGGDMGDITHSVGWNLRVLGEPIEGY